MFDARKGQITITRGDTGLLAIVPTGYVPTSQDRMFFMVAEMPDGRIVINKTVTPDDDGVCKLMFSGTDTENLSKRHREYTYAIRFALDVTESNGKITGYREMITPEPPGCFVVLEANGCPACTCETQNAGSMEVKLESFRGPKGDRGETGPIGPQGTKGEKGDKGDRGEKGDTGPQGETGAKGNKGDKGDTGAKGEPGKDAVIDATLTQEGEAADAATTGKRLAEIEKAVAEKADKARQNILIGSETGNPVSVSDAFSAPLCGLTVYGKSTQDGTPSPDNPVPIVSAGDGGTITVTIGDGADERQTITLQTPNGLPGIPVTSGGNYTDPTGRQWVCDEVDLEKGVRVQRIDKSAFDSTKTLVEQNAILATPVETPLTPAEIAAYKALTTYAPNTVVQAADGAGLKLDYQRDVNIVIKNLEDAIASMTTT
ncbi:MAG: hypothetical protein ACLVMH_05355 [Christensenellales bacterium]